VGGGYPAHESELSDIAPDWMARELKDAGVRFGSPLYDPFAPDRRGIAHKPWNHLPFKYQPVRPRSFANTGVQEHPSVPARMNSGPVVAEPGEPPAPYVPANRP